MKPCKSATLISVIGLLILMVSCTKDKQPIAPITPLSFTSLNADPQIVSVDQTTTITATASGDDLVYIWTLTGTGNLIGSGHQIIYRPCCTGQQIINCTVKDNKDKTITKSITVDVQ